MSCTDCHIMRSYGTRPGQYHGELCYFCIYEYKEADIKALVRFEFNLFKHGIKSNVECICPICKKRHVFPLPDDYINDKYSLKRDGLFVAICGYHYPKLEHEIEDLLNKSEYDQFLWRSQPRDDLFYQSPEML